MLFYLILFICSFRLDIELMYFYWDAYTCASFVKIVFNPEVDCRSGNVYYPVAVPIRYIGSAYFTSGCSWQAMGGKFRVINYFFY